MDDGLLKEAQYRFLPAAKRLGQGKVWFFQKKKKTFVKFCFLVQSSFTICLFRLLPWQIWSIFVQINFNSFNFQLLCPFSSILVREVVAVQGPLAICIRIFDLP